MRINRLLIAGIVSVGLLTSCASDEESSGGTSSPATINLSLTTVTRAGGAATGATAIPTDGGGSIGTNEGVVNHVYVGVFDNANYRMTTNVTDYDYNASGQSITTTTKAKNIYVAANIPAAIAATYNTTTAKTLTLFQSLVQDLSYTTSTNGLSNTAANTVNSQSATGLPMFGSATLDFTKTTVSVPLTRAVARVALTKLATAFTGTSYDGATFIPKEVFMYNVNDKYTWGTGLGSSSVTTVTGESTDKSTTNMAALASSASNSNFFYLSSGLTAYTSSSSDQTYIDPTKTPADNPYFFYVFPHDATSPTKLVVKGVFTLNGTSEVMYYPIVVNKFLDAASTTFSGGVTTHDSQVSQNTCYGINLTIKGRGVDDPSKDIVPATVTLNMTVNAWSTSSEDMTVN